jgi:thiol-disulfide isomerase/thioredoxin
MKNLFLTFLLALALLGCNQKRPASIDNPVFETWNSDVIEITKIETTDSATILHLNASYRPGYWIRIVQDSYIKESGTDSKLLLTKADGIKIDEKHWMPDSGKSSFKLYFPPLDPGITKIDFIESDCETCFKIWGISLLPDTEIAIFSQADVTDDQESTPLPEPAFNDQPAKVSGQLHGFNKSLMPYEITFYSSNLITGGQQKTKLTVEEDGTFGGDVAVNHPSVVYTDQFGSLFLTPGKKVKLFVDLKKKARFESRHRNDKQPGDSLYIYTEGSPITAAQLTEVTNMMNNLLDQEAITLEVADMTADEFKNYMINKWNSTKEQIEAGDLNTSQQKVLSSMLQNQILIHLMNYEGFLKQAHFVANDIPFQQWTEIDFQVEKPGEDFYSFIPEFVHDNLTYDMRFSGPLSDFMKLPKFSNAEENITGIEKAKTIGSQMEQQIDENNDLIIEAVKAQTLYQELQDLHFLSDEDKEQLKTLFANESVADYLITENDDFKKLVEANKEASGDEFVIHEIPEVAQDEVFKAILADYKGKTVVIDFWATWCGPCIYGMEQMKPLKEEMKDENVVFVYLTGETSPNGTWNKMIPDIHGHHYRVSDAQWKLWYNDFNLEGVPTFMIFNKNGEQTARHTGFPGVDEIRKAITEG